MMYVLLLIGFVALIKGADFFVEGSSGLARLLGVPSVIIGLTIVALGTSAPEAAVSITAGLAGRNEIAISNVVGSNMFNLLVVAGVCGVIKAFPMDRDIMHRDFPVNIAANLLLLVLCVGGMLSRGEGLLLLVCMVAYLVYIVRCALKDRASLTAEEAAEPISPLRCAVCIVGGLAAVLLGGTLVVDSAVSIATAWGLSETFIGLTIIAMGTSLPELVTSVVAARKGESGLALGNVVGSNIFNILFILGISSTLHPITVVGDSLVTTVLLLIVTAGIFLWCRAKGWMTRRVASVCVLGYLTYTGMLLAM